MSEAWYTTPLDCSCIRQTLHAQYDSEPVKNMFRTLMYLVYNSSTLEQPRYETENNVHRKL